MSALIGVDIGTGGTKAALFDEGGACLAQAFRASALHRPRPGAVEEDPERQFASVCETIRECVEKAGTRDVAAIGIDGQMAGVIGLGRDGRNATPYDSWLDTRCGPQIRAMNDAAGDEVLARTGCPPSFNHGPKILWWKQTRPRDYKRIAAFVQPGGYAAMRLCGLGAAEAFVDKTYLHFSGFADNRRARWDAGLCASFDVDASKLPRIVDPQSIVGELTNESAAACGFGKPIPVIAGCGDTAASFLACGATRVGIGVDVAGTASVFAATTDAFKADKKHRMLGCGRSAVPGLWHPYAYINGGGLNLDWFRREVANAGRADGAIDFAQLEAFAAAVDARGDDPIFIPHLGGRVCPAATDLRGAWIGLAWHHTIGHLYRAMLEGVALEYGVYRRVLRSLFAGGLAELRVTGGGERNTLWNGIKADALGTPVRQIVGGEGAPRGVAMLAGWGVGLLRDLPTAAKTWVRLGATRRPVARAGDGARLAAYERAMTCLDGIMKERP